MQPEQTPAVVILRYAGDSRERLDRWLAGELGVSRAAAQRAIVEGRVTVAGKLATKAMTPDAGDEVRVVTVDETPPERPAPPTVPVLYADAQLALIDKPAGLAVYAGAGHSDRATLADALRAQVPALATLMAPEPHRPGIVHRLDADTSGVMVIGLDEATVAALQDQFRRRTTAKTYLALVHGHVTPEQALIDAPIGRHPHERTRMAVVYEGGREARTAYRLIEQLGDASLLEVELLTGRTHQIRVHLASIGHPVMGDRTYGPRRRAPGAARQMLHAWRLCLTHPLTGAALCGEAPVPDDFQRMLARLRG